MLHQLWTDAREKTAKFDETIKGPYRLFHSKGGPAIALGPRGIVAFNEIVTVLVDDEVIGQKFSRKELQRQIEGVVTDLTNADPENVRAQIDSSIDQFDDRLRKTNLVNWEVYLPIQNLIVHSEISLGLASITMYNEETGRSIIAHMDQIETKSPPEIEEKVRQLVADKLAGDYAKKAVMRIQTRAADGERAIESAIEGAETVLNTLRFYSRGAIKQDARFYRMFIGLKGSISTGQLFATALAGDSFETKFSNVGYFYALDLDDDAIKMMEKDSFPKMHEILRKEPNQRTAFQNLIVNSVNLFGAAMNNPTTVNAFVTLVIALESILLKKAEPIKSLLAERVALLLGGNYDDRMFYFTQVSRLYQMRSDVVHSGFADVTENDVSMLSMIGYRVLVRLISMSPDINDIGKLVEMFNRRKFESSGGNSRSMFVP
jgi:hypothetical protein